MSKFKVGDRVQSNFYAKTGVVLEIRMQGKYTYVVVDVGGISGIPTTFLDTELELIVEKPKFAVGDMVEAKAVGRVSEIEDQYITVDFEGQPRYTFDITDDIFTLTKVTPPFPDAAGSRIKATHIYNDNEVLELVRVASNIGEPDHLWVDLKDASRADEKTLNLISVEYDAGSN